jgi:hypothetical protein
MEKNDKISYEHFSPLELIFLRSLYEQDVLILSSVLKLGLHNFSALQNNISSVSPEKTGWDFVVRNKESSSPALPKEQLSGSDLSEARLSIAKDLITIFGNPFTLKSLINPYQYFYYEPLKYAENKAKLVQLRQQAKENNWEVNQKIKAIKESNGNFYAFRNPLHFYFTPEEFNTAATRFFFFDSERAPHPSYLFSKIAQVLIENGMANAPLKHIHDISGFHPIVNFLASPDDHSDIITAFMKDGLDPNLLVSEHNNPEQRSILDDYQKSSLLAFCVHPNHAKVLLEYGASVEDPQEPLFGDIAARLNHNIEHSNHHITSARKEELKKEIQTQVAAYSTNPDREIDQFIYSFAFDNINSLKKEFNPNFESVVFKERHSLGLTPLYMLASLEYKQAAGSKSNRKIDFSPLRTIVEKYPLRFSEKLSNGTSFFEYTLYHLKPLDNWGTHKTIVSSREALFESLSKTPAYKHFFPDSLFIESNKTKEDVQPWVDFMINGLKYSGSAAMTHQHDSNTPLYRLTAKIHPGVLSTILSNGKTARTSICEAYKDAVIHSQAPHRFATMFEPVLVQLISQMEATFLHEGFATENNDSFKNQIAPFNNHESQKEKLAHFSLEEKQAALLFLLSRSSNYSLSGMRFEYPARYDGSEKSQFLAKALLNSGATLSEIPSTFKEKTLSLAQDVRTSAFFESLYLNSIQEKTQKPRARTAL